MATPIYNITTLATTSSERNTINAAINIEEVLASSTVDDFNLTTPPVAPPDGYKAIIGVGATGVWAGFDRHIAVYVAGWYFYPPSQKYGAQFSRTNLGEYYLYSSALTSWQVFTPGGGGGGVSLRRYTSSTGTPTTGQLRITNPSLGVYNLEIHSTDADGNLLTDLFGPAAQVGTIIDILSADTATNKVSATVTNADYTISGSVWTFRISPFPVVFFPAGEELALSFQPVNTKEKLIEPRTYYVRTDGNDLNDGFSDSPTGALASWTFAMRKLWNIDRDGYQVTIQAGGTGVRTWTLSESIDVTDNHRGRIVFSGDPTTPSNVRLIAPALQFEHFTSTYNVGLVQIDGMQLEATEDYTTHLYVRLKGRIIAKDVIFTGAFMDPIFISQGGTVFAEGTLTFNSANPDSFIYALGESRFQRTPDGGPFTLAVQTGAAIDGAGIVADNQSIVNLDGATISASGVTGRRYILESGASIIRSGNVLGYTSLPGNVNGTIQPYRGSKFGSRLRNDNPASPAYSTGSLRLHTGLENNAAMAAAAALVPDQMVAYPIMVHQTASLASVLFNVISGTAGVVIAFYKDNGFGFPGERVYVSTATATPGVNTRAGTAEPLDPGLYWVTYNAAAAINVSQFQATSLHPILGIDPAFTGPRTYLFESRPYASGLPTTFTMTTVNYGTITDSVLAVAFYVADQF